MRTPSAWCGRRDSNPHLQRGVLGSTPLDDDHEAIREPGGTREWYCRLQPLRLAADLPVRGVLLGGKYPRSCASDRDGHPGGIRTLVSWSAATRLTPRPPGGDVCLLPGRASNPHLPGNNRTSCPPTTWHWLLGTATGSRTPASGLRTRRPRRWTTAAWRKRWDSHPQGPQGPLPAFEAGSSSGRIASVLVASLARFERATPAVGRRCSHPLSYSELVLVSTAGVEPATSGFARRRRVRWATSTRTRRQGGR